MFGSISDRLAGQQPAVLDLDLEAAAVDMAQHFGSSWAGES